MILKLKNEDWGRTPLKNDVATFSRARALCIRSYLQRHKKMTRNLCRASGALPVPLA